MKQHTKVIRRADRRPFYRGWYNLMAAMAFLVFLPLTQSMVLAANPGNNNPITSPRRTLFPDQHALVAMPQNPNSLQVSTTYTDWARSANVQNLEFQEAFDNQLQVNRQARSAAGHILSQKLEQVAVGGFVGNSDTFRLDILSPDGQVTPDAGVSFSGYSTNRGVGQAVQAIDSFAVTVGELSQLSDETGAGHDEVAVCYPVNEGGGGSTGVLRMHVRVLDYTDLENSGVIQTSAISSHTFTNQGNYKFDRVIRENGSDSFIGCSAADVNGDGVDEVVMAYMTGAYAPIWVDVFQYTNNGADSPTLERVGSPLSLEPLVNPALPVTTFPQFVGTLDLVAGDFNADGRQEIGIATVTMEFTSSLIGLGYFPGIFVLSSDNNYNLKPQGTFVTDAIGFLNETQFFNSTGSFACRQIRSRSACEYMRAAIVPGLFQYNPDPVVGFDFNRRQLAVVFNMPFAQGGGLRAVALEISNDLQTITQTGNTVTIPQQTCTSGFCPSSPRFSVGTGGYVGSADIENPLWSLAVTNWEATGNGSADLQSAGQFRLAWLKALPPGSDGGFTIAQNITPLGSNTISGPTNGRLPAVAWDREGNSVWLGSPIHLVVYDLIKPEYIIQEPPKHAYWWPPNATNPADGQIMDLSRKYGFYVELSDEEKKDYSFTHQDQTDWTIGGSLAVTAKASVTTGVDAGIFGKASVTGSTTVQGKVGYDYNENVDEYESNYRSQTTTFTGQTNADDLLIADLTRMDIWRYPVSGIDFGDGLNSFWEIAFPGDTITARGGGLTFDWYEPPHENGNILSYPPLTGNSYTPADCCAEFTFLENSQEVSEAIPFLAPTRLGWDGTSGTIALNFSETTGQGSTKSYTHKLAESLDVQVGYKAEGKTLGTKVEAELTVDANISNSNSWAEVDTESASTNNSTGFKLVKQVGNTNQSYFFMPQFYLTQSGTTKVSYAVDPLGTGATFWPSTYGQLPDPALNLPRRFSPTTPTDHDQIVWVVNPEDDAKRMRGLFFRYNTLDQTNEYPLIAGAVTDGNVIRVEADVYNYSVGQGFGGLDVAFQAVRYNAVTNSEIGDPVTIPCGTGSITTLGMDPRARKQAVCIWDTTGSGPTIPGAIQYYRIYVTLDPDNHITEIYDGTIGPGQNNQGWGLVGVANAQDTFLTPVATEAVPNGADVNVTRDALEMVVDGQFISGTAHVVREQTTPLRVCVDTNQTQTGYHHVLLWNGDPQNGGTLIADKMLPGIDRNGESCAWLPAFHPEISGNQTFYAQVLETGTDALPGNATDTLDVIVDDIPSIFLAHAQGIADHVGTERIAGDLHLTGRFSYSGDLDLSVAQLVIANVLNEMQGAGELIPGVTDQTGQDLVLYATHSTRHSAIFATPHGVVPKVRATLASRKGELQLDLYIRDAAILQPENCDGRTNLTTELVLLDAEHAPVNLSIIEPWTCILDKWDQVEKLILDSRIDTHEHKNKRHDQFGEKRWSAAKERR